MMFGKRSTRTMEPRFRLFFVSSALLLVSLCMLTYVEFYMQDSVKQELLGLVALILGALAGLGTMIAYLAILWHRLKGFFSHDKRE